MKSVNKNRMPNNTPSAGSLKTVNNSLSGSQKVEIIRAGLDVINSGSSLLTEIQKTKQAAIDAQVRMKESDNKLFEKVAEFQKEVIEIERKYNIEFKKLDDDFKLKSRKLDLVEKMIDKIDSLEVQITVYQNEQGLDSATVMILFDKLHEQKLAFMKDLVTLGSQ
ncbi:hypothetical protein [uncultured Psychrobacter sp.]|uniref:hypothetical protein n=1 Tax=uncultured Psychrobacter sp. TaxID=259303 RepID=UPI00345A1B79